MHPYSHRRQIQPIIISPTACSVPCRASSRIRRRMPAMQDALPLEIADLELDSQTPRALEPGIWRVPVPVPFGARVVNLYLLGAPVAAAQGSQSWCLVDCPLDTPPAEAALRDALDRIGAAPTAISAIVL